MPAVPRSVESNSNASNSSYDREREFTALYQETGFTDVSNLAFTVIQKDSLKDNSDEESDSTDQTLDVEDENVSEKIKRKQKIFSRFNGNDRDQKILNRSNAYLLQQKLIDLSRSNSSLRNQKVQNKSINLSNVINNLREQRTLSKSNGHLPSQEKHQPEKDESKSFNNLQRRSTNQSKINIEKEHKNYHRYCHLSGSNYLYNNMTSVKQKPNYEQEYSNLTDARTQKNETEIGKRKSPQGRESYITINRNNNNNNINGAKNNDKNNHYYGNNYTKNGYTNNIKMNEKNRLNNDENRKPIFITTVKTGKFLDPPPELAILLGLSHNLNDSVTSSTDGSSNSLNTSVRERHQQQALLYSFSSQPRVLHQQYHRAKCDAAARAANNTPQRVRREATNNNSIQYKP
jgi:hypothetical protein